MSRLGAAIGWGTIALVCGCSLSDATTENQCGHGVDGDGDGLMDCADPDCQALESCRLGGAAASTDQHASPEIGTAVTGSLAPKPQHAAPATDAQAPPEASDAQDVAEASDGTPPDSKTPDPLGCAGDCPAACGGDVCPADAGDGVTVWTITQLDLTVPRRVDSTTCLDTACSSPRWSPSYWTCTCAPNAIVEVVVDGALVAETTEVEGDSAQWQTAIPLALGAQSTFWLKAFDRDQAGDQAIFGCQFMVESAALASGSVVCAKTFTASTGAIEYRITASVTAPVN